MPFALALLVLFVVRARPLDAQGQGAANEFNDSHFHLTNYIQQGIEARQFLQIMGTASAARRCSAFRCSSTGRTRTPATSRRPTTCRATRRSTTTRSPTPTSRAPTSRCRQAEQARFDPMITGFNPADMYGVDHIRRVLTTFPGVFTGIGEFSIHKEFVSSKDRRRDRQPDQPGARPHPRLRRRSRPRRDPAQRHRHAVRARSIPSRST